METKFGIEVEGHVHIVDDLGEVLLDKTNLINPENFGVILARGLAKSPDYWVQSMHFGNGGATIDAGTGAITYLPAITSPSAATMYNQTYLEIVEDGVGNDGQGGPANSVVDSSGAGITSVVTVMASLDSTQPVGQLPLDQNLDFENQFSLDEISLFSPDGLMLSHIIFSPILKSANRSLLVTYTLTITVSNI